MLSLQGVCSRSPSRVTTPGWVFSRGQILPGGFVRTALLRGTEAHLREARDCRPVVRETADFHPSAFKQLRTVTQNYSVFRSFAKCNIAVSD
jgi:hypothetical protein